MSTQPSVLQTPADPAASLETLRTRGTVSVAEAAQILGIGRNAAYEAIHRNEVPHLQFGKRIVVPTAPLLRLLGIDA